jgi:hypothetical protein
VQYRTDTRNAPRYKEVCFELFATIWREARVIGTREMLAQVKIDLEKKGRLTCCSESEIEHRN